MLHGRRLSPIKTVVDERSLHRTEGKSVLYRHMAKVGWGKLRLYSIKHTEGTFTEKREFMQVAKPSKYFCKRTFPTGGPCCEHKSTRRTSSRFGERSSAPLVVKNFVRTYHMVNTDGENQRRMYVGLHTIAIPRYIRRITFPCSRRFYPSKRFAYSYA